MNIKLFSYLATQGGRGMVKVQYAEYGGKVQNENWPFPKRSEKCMIHPAE